MERKSYGRRLSLLITLVLVLNMCLVVVPTAPITVTASTQLLGIKQIKKLPEGKKLTWKMLRKSIKVIDKKNGKEIKNYKCKQLGKRVTCNNKGKMLLTIIKGSKVKAKWVNVKKAKNITVEIVNKVVTFAPFEPTPTQPERNPSIVIPTVLPTAVPKETVAPTANTATCTPQATTIPTVRPEVTESPKVTESPSPTPVQVIYPSISGGGIIIVKPTKTPEPTKIPVVTKAPEVTKVPQVTKVPEETNRPHEHEYKKTYVVKDDVKHSVTISCILCGYSEETEDELHDLKWQYEGDNKDSGACSKCGYKEEREHQHEDKEVSALEYVCVASNQNGTHKMQAVFECSICGESVVISKDEDCSIEVTYEKTEVDNSHTVVNTCIVCTNITKEEGVCVPTGEIKTIKEENNIIYEYFECLYCGDECNKEEHTNHIWNPWEPNGEKEHIRYCICIEARQNEEHQLFVPMDDAGVVIQDTTIVCNDCGYEKFIKAHNHKKGIKDNMNLMDLVMSEAYKSGECLTQSQVYNPNPGLGVWCSRYEFKCQECGLKYYMTNDHNIENGYCTRKNCVFNAA